MPARRMHIANLDSRIELPRRGFLGKIGAFFAGAALLAKARPAPAAVQDGDPWIGEIALVPFTFAPRGWAFCNGQLLPINQNQALFSLLGTNFGGNGQTTFGLPDLRGRVPIHAGQGSGLSNYVLGQIGGAESETLNANQMPIHNHVAYADSANGSSDIPTSHLLAKNAAGVPQYGITASVALAPGAIGNAGGSQPHNNIQPFLTLNYVIALEGIYPSQS